MGLAPLAAPAIRHQRAVSSLDGLDGAGGEHHERRGPRVVAQARSGRRALGGFRPRRGSASNGMRATSGRWKKNRRAPRRERGGSRKARPGRGPGRGSSSRIQSWSMLRGLLRFAVSGFACVCKPHMTPGLSWSLPVTLWYIDATFGDGSKGPRSVILDGLREELPGSYMKPKPLTVH